MHTQMQDTTDPATAANAWVQQLRRIHVARPTARILIGEMGYSNAIDVDDTTQENVLQEELNALSSVPYLAGINYWVGAGTAASGGYTHIFTGKTGHWSFRPAAYVLASFYSEIQMIIILQHQPYLRLLLLSLEVVKLTPTLMLANFR